MYSDTIFVNKNFQSSINLELDLYNEKKINEYIPTADICDVLKRYVLTFLGKSKEKSTVLVGPYGKGKSFILLVISYLFSNKKNDKAWIDLVEKIGKVDNDLKLLLLEVKEKNINLLTILVNSNYDNITQSFQLALNDALKREKLDNLIPQNIFSICNELLDKWLKDEKIKGEIFNRCLEITGCSIDELKIGLENFSVQAYKQFEKLYNCVNIGLSFNPLIGNDVVKTYKDVSLELNKYGYQGIFVIFDEFSKFIESTSANLMADLKMLQDFAELCSRSNSNYQLNLCCVTHKPLSLYSISGKQNNSFLDSFKTVEGRFVEIRFNRSLDENYQIISSAIIKNEKAKKTSVDFIKNNKEFYNNIEGLKIFSEDKDFFTGCFPLNPLTVYTLIQLSEYVAQNERTLFTFLSDSDENSFNSFIHNNNFGLFNVDKIYDYFNSLLQKEETNSIRNIWYRAESLLNKINDQNERRLIKALAVILMINDFEKIPATEKILSLCTFIDEREVTKIISNLIDKHFLRKNILNNMLSFALSNSKHIDETIDYLSKTKFKSIKYPLILDEIIEKRFILPRRYNEQNKITRFYKVIFITEEEFLNITNFNYYFSSNYCDGIVFNLLRINLSNEEIRNRVDEIGDIRIIVRYPQKSIDYNFFKSVTCFACLSEIKNQKNIDEISLEEIELLLEETKSDIKQLINDYFEKNCLFVSSFSKSINFNSLLSEILENIYSEKVIFNNELINKKIISPQYQKAINHVIDYLLGEGDFVYSETSPEMSVKYSVIDANENSSTLRKILDEIKDKISCSNSNRNKISIYEIMHKYSLPPYGIRDGLIPVIFTKAISELPDDSIILYFQTKEIGLDASNIQKAVFNNKYFISFSKSSNEQRNYLKKLLVLFDGISTNNFRKDIVLATELLKKYFIGLPQIIRINNISNNFLNLNDDFILYKNIFLSYNINPFEALFIESKKIFKVKTFDDLFEKIEEIKTNGIAIIAPYKQKVISLIKQSMLIDFNTSLKMGIEQWIRKYLKTDSKPILSDENKQIFKAIKEGLSFNDFEAINILSFASIGIYIEDWDKDYSKKLQDNITEFKNIIENSKFVDSKEIVNNIIDQEKNIEFTPMGDLLKNNLESVLEEFSDSVSSDEKISILSEIVKKIIE